MPEQKCSKTSKVIYTSASKAKAAIVALENANRGIPGLHAYECKGRGHWHLGHSAPKGQRARSDRDEAVEAGTRRGRGVQRPEFTPEQWDAATMALWSRCRDACEWCGKPLVGQLVRHHRQRRGVGGDRLANLVALHDLCHKRIHENDQARARVMGFIVSSYDDDPAAEPITIGGRLWLLDDEGRKRPVP